MSVFFQIGSLWSGYNPNLRGEIILTFLFLSLLPDGRKKASSGFPDEAIVSLERRIMFSVLQFLFPTPAAEADTHQAESGEDRSGRLGDDGAHVGNH